MLPVQNAIYLLPWWIHGRSAENGFLAFRCSSSSSSPLLLLRFFSSLFLCCARETLWSAQLTKRGKQLGKLLSWVPGDNVFFFAANFFSFIFFIVLLFIIRIPAWMLEPQTRARANVIKSNEKKDVWRTGRIRFFVDVTDEHKFGAWAAG